MSLPMLRALLSLVIAGLAFGGSHVLLSSTRLRGSLRDVLGEGGFLAVYSLVALVTFAWFLAAFAHAPIVPLWRRQPWMALAPIIVMPFSSILLVAGYTTSNPTAVGMERAARADEPAPGILAVTRHPVMWAIGLWALSHMLPNGNLAALYFFGVLAALAFAGTVLIDRKKRLALGSHWSRLSEASSNLPFAALVAGRARLRWRDLGALRLVAGLLFYAVLYLAHPILTGLPVFFSW
jgi:uncharacterized membrane protein